MVFGPPGSGKGTQANLLAAKLGLIHFDTGKFLESIVYDPVRQKEKVAKRERRIFENGGLMTPSFVFREVKKAVTRICKAGWGVVFSGSPRTEYEVKGLVPVLEKLYGRKNIFAFVLNVPPKESIARNSRRIVCSICRAPLLTAYYPSKNPKHCPICGGKFYKRTLDNPETIKVRLKEYEERTEPVFKILVERGYHLVKVDGRPAPYRIFQNIYARFKNIS